MSTVFENLEIEKEYASLIRSYMEVLKKLEFG
jgi:hypothetical protein